MSHGLTDTIFRGGNNSGPKAEKISIISARVYPGLKPINEPHETGCIFRILQKMQAEFRASRLENGISFAAYQLV